MPTSPADTEMQARAGHAFTPPVLLASGLVVEIALHFFLPLTVVVDGSARWVSLALLMAGLIINITQARAFERIGTPIHPFAEPLYLRREGAYRWSRNPMYFGLLLILAGAAIGLGTLSPWIVPPLFAWIVTVRFIRREEEALTTRFGAEYTTYRAAVRRWI